MLLGLVILSTAATVSARLFHRIPTIPDGWKIASPALPGDEVTLKIGLKQQHSAALEQAVLNISTPDHPDYGNHMTREELRSYVAPRQQSVDDVVSWLAKHGIVPAIDNDWMTIATDVKTANEMLDADFKWYHHEEDDVLKLRTLRYSVPDSVAEHVDLVHPTTRFGHPRLRRSTIFEVTRSDEVPGLSLMQADVPTDTASSDPAFCTTTVTPECIRAQYNIGYKPHSGHNNRVAFASYLEEYARYDDLEQFQEMFVPKAVGQNFSVTLISGGLNDQSSSSSSVEANLDLQYLLSTSHPISIEEYSTGGRGPLVPTLDNGFPSTNEPYLEFLTYILNLKDHHLPQTLTTSYGEEEQSVPPEYALKVCNLFMQLGARGVSVLFSSGDSGPGNSCRSNADNATTTFLPTFPAGCPYVTSVGATTSSRPERGVSFSSGGFSTYHPRPAWQDGAVQGYLSSLDGTYRGLFDPLGRGIPDVAAQGQGFVVVDKGREAHVSGTSASAPVFAGVVALLNAARRSKGHKPLGFLNPWLYKHADALLDITEGYSAGCVGVRGLRKGVRLNCTTGWDPVTGLGTPLFDRLLEKAAPGVLNEGNE